jgi:hypothetical protein
MAQTNAMGYAMAARPLSACALRSTVQQFRASFGIVLPFVVCVVAGCNQTAPPAPVEPPAVAPAAPVPAPIPEVATPPAGAKVMFLEPSDGATVKGAAKDGKVDVAVKMGVEGMSVVPAGELKPNAGHHHIVIDAAPPGQNTVVPKDEQHIHYGKGQTEAVLALTPGLHTLTLQFADGMHRSYGPAMSSSVKITVVDDPNAAAGTPTGK